MKWKNFKQYWKSSQAVVKQLSKNSQKCLIFRIFLILDSQIFYTLPYHFMDILTESQIVQFVAETQGRTYEENMLKCTYEFDNFLEAIWFVNEVAEVCESLNHHANIDIRYNEVHIATTTHDVDNQITEKDIDLAQKIEELLD